MQGEVDQLDLPLVRLVRRRLSDPAEPAGRGTGRRVLRGGAGSCSGSLSGSPKARQAGAGGSPVIPSCGTPVPR